MWPQLIAPFVLLECKSGELVIFTHNFVIVFTSNGSTIALAPWVKTHYSGQRLLSQILLFETTFFELSPS
jgi:hypothetical protein